MPKASNPTLFLLFLLSAIPVVASEFVVEDFEKTFDVSGRPQIVIRNQDGRTSIHGGPGSQVVVHVVKEVSHVRTAEEARKVAEKVKVRIAQNGNQVEVTAEYPDFHFQIGQSPRVAVHFEVTSPVESDVDISAADGPVQIDSMNGSVKVRVADGDVAASQLNGKVTLSASDGDIQANKISGDVEMSVADGQIATEEGKGSIRLSSADGRITLRKWEGDVQAKSSDGHALLEGVFGSIHAHAADGNMEIRAEEGSLMNGSWSIQSQDGDIVLHLPEGFSADLQASTSDGHIVTDLPVSVQGSLTPSRLEGHLHNGGPLLQIRTADGNILITR